MLAVIPPLVTFVAVMVNDPIVLRVILKFLVPEANVALEGRIDAASELEIAIVFEGAVGTIFQNASTAFTVTVKGVVVFCPVGVPVFPLPVPGAVVSPGNNSCNLANAPGFTIISPAA